MLTASLSTPTPQATAQAPYRESPTPAVGRSLPGRLDLRPEERRAPSHIILVVMDTVRADALESLGGALPADDAVTPTIDSLAGEGLLFRSAISLSSWTKPSVVTMLSSAEPEDHGVGYLSSRVGGGLWWLPEKLRAAGLATAAFVANPVLEGDLGLARGFDEYRLDASADSTETFGERRVRFCSG